MSWGHLGAHGHRHIIGREIPAGPHAGAAAQFSTSCAWARWKAAAALAAAVWGGGHGVGCQLPTRGWRRRQQRQRPARLARTGPPRCSPPSLDLQAVEAVAEMAPIVLQVPRAGGLRIWEAGATACAADDVAARRGVKCPPLPQLPHRATPPSYPASPHRQNSLTHTAAAAALQPASNKEMGASVPAKLAVAVDTKAGAVHHPAGCAGRTRPGEQRGPLCTPGSSARTRASAAPGWSARSSGRQPRPKRCRAQRDGGGDGGDGARVPAPSPRHLLRRPASPLSCPLRCRTGWRRTAATPTTTRWRPTRWVVHGPWARARLLLPLHGCPCTASRVPVGPPRTPLRAPPLPHTTATAAGRRG